MTKQKYKERRKMVNTILHILIQQQDIFWNTLLLELLPIANGFEMDKIVSKNAGLMVLFNISVKSREENLSLVSKHSILLKVERYRIKKQNTFF